VLKHLTVKDVYTVISLCDAANAEASGEVVAAKDISLEKLLEDSPEEKALEDFLRSLSGDAITELQALLWTGRGDGDRNFAENLEDAYETTDAGTVRYIAEKSPALPLYLRTGLKSPKSN
jgi:hypothetical protein